MMDNLNDTNMHISVKVSGRCLTLANQLYLLAPEISDKHRGRLMRL